MRKLFLTIVLALAVPHFAAAEENQRHYRWVDKDGLVHYGDRIPAEYAELPKDVVNSHGVTVDNLAGKKTEEQIAAEKIENERRLIAEKQRRADVALLATYLSVDEILMHRDRRVELFQAQSRVTELYLRNLKRRLESLRGDASKYSPYSREEDAPMIPEELATDLRQTRDTIDRHERNLEKFQSDEQTMITRFDSDITRFKVLKGID